MKSIEKKVLEVMPIYIGCLMITVLILVSSLISDMFFLFLFYVYGLIMGGLMGYKLRAMEDIANDNQDTDNEDTHEYFSLW